MRAIWFFAVAETHAVYVKLWLITNTQKLALIFQLPINLWVTLEEVSQNNIYLRGMGALEGPCSFLKNVIL